MKKARWISVLMATLLLGLGAANAGTITGATMPGWVTPGGITGTGFAPFSTVRVSFRDSSGVITPGTYTADSLGNISGGIPAGVQKGYRIFYSGTEGTGKVDNNAVGGVVASANPPRNGTAIGVYIVDAGSTLDIGSQDFSLAGSFTTIETAFDNDPSSPNYADVSFSIPATDFNVYSNTGPLTVSLSADDAFTMNVLPFLNAVNSGAFTSTTLPVSFPVNFVLTYAGTSYSASGTVSGSMTSTMDNQADPDTFDLSLTSGLGPITGSLYTTASYTVTPEPAPAFLLLTGLALIALVRLRARIAPAV